MLNSFEKRIVKLSHGSAIPAWICWVHPDVRSDVKKRFEKAIHKDTTERITVKLHACGTYRRYYCGDHKYFLKKWKIFAKKIGVYLKKNRWNARDVLDDKSTEWHALYYRGRTEVLGYVAPRCTSALTGMGASERAWACTKKS